MSTVKIIGVDASNYVRTVRIACAEKGVDYDLSFAEMTDIEDLKSPAHLKRHPFGRIPVMIHGDFTLYETSAICRYVDTAFDGPPSMPEGVAAQAVMEQWISALNCYLDGDIIRRYVIEYVFPKGDNDTPRMDVINEALVDIRRDLAVFDTALEGGPFLFGDQPTIPDFLLLPMVNYLAVMPGGAELLEQAANVARFHDAFKTRPSYNSTLPDRLKSKAA